MNPLPDDRFPIDLFGLLLGTYQKESSHNYRLIADRTSIVIDWGDEWHERIRRFQKRQLKGKCKSEQESGF